MMDGRQLARVAWGIAQLGYLPDAFWVSGFIARTRACIPEVRGIYHISQRIN